MAKLTDDPKVAEALQKAETRGASNERKRINALIGEHSKADEVTKDGKAALKALKSAIREDA